MPQLWKDKLAARDNHPWDLRTIVPSQHKHSSCVCEGSETINVWVGGLRSVNPGIVGDMDFVQKRWYEAFINYAKAREPKMMVYSYSWMNLQIDAGGS